MTATPEPLEPNDCDPPDAGAVESVLVRLGDLQHRRLFFERLQNPWWVRGLDEAGAFDRAPDLQEDDAGQLRFRPWPEGEYLARMAGAMPEDVARIFLRLGGTPNPYIARLVAQAAAKMPATSAASLANLVAGYLHEPWANYIDPLDVVGLIKLLATGDRLKAAARLAAHAYRPRADPDADPNAYRVTVSAGLEVYWYGETLPQVVEALTPMGRVLVRTLRAWLEHYQVVSGSFNEATSGDTSSIWRPSISPHEQNQGMEEIGDLLVDALRDAIPAVVGTSESDALDLLRELFDSRQPLIKRIAIHALAEMRLPNASEASVDLAYNWLTSETVLEADLRREYAHLARRFLPSLDGDRADAWANVVFAGPPWSAERLALIAARARSDGEPEDAIVQRYRRLWRHGTLSAIGHEALPPAARELLEELDREDGEYPHAEFTSYMSSWVGDRSPVDVEELETWDTESVVSFLESWEPDGRAYAGPEPSRDGLAGVVRAVVRSQPARWSSDAPRLRTTRAVFVRAAIDGLREAVKDGAEIGWPEVLDLAQFCVEQQDPTADASEPVDDETRWRWAHRSVVSLLDAGIDAEGPARIPDLLLERVRQLLDPLSRASEPTPDYEAQYGGTNMDPLTLSLNTLRPAATRAVLRLVARILVPIRTDADARSLDYAGASASPVAAAALASLEERVGFDRDPSLAMAAVFGEALARLAWLDRDWLSARLPDLMRADEAYRDVVISTALATYRASSLLVELLEPWIEPWLERAVRGESVLGWRAQRGAIQLWADHLTLLYGHGLLELDSVPLQQFFAVATSSDVGNALGHLGWMLVGSDEVAAPFLQRASALWDARLTEVQEGRAELEELAGFSWWVESDKFPAEWWLPRLRVAATAPSFEVHGKMGERLADAADAHPRETVEVLTVLLTARSEPFRRFGLMQKAPDVLATALDVGDDATQRAARDLMDQLGREGHLEILELVNGRRTAGR